MNKYVILPLLLLAVSANAQWVRSLSTGSPVVNFVTVGSTLIAGTSGRDTSEFIYSDTTQHLAPSIYLTTDHGATWSAPATGIAAGGCVNAFALDGANVYAAIAGSPDKSDINPETVIYLSSSATQYGAWDPLHKYTPDFYYGCWGMAVSGANLFIGGIGGVYRSTDGGWSWVHPQGAIDQVSALLPLSDTSMIAGTASTGLYRTFDNGESWTAINSGVTGTYAGESILSLVASGSYIFAGTPAGVFRSSDRGSHWSRAINGLADTNVTCLAVSGSTLFAGTSTRIIDSAYNYLGYYFAAMVGGGVYRSTDNGTSWTEVNTGFPTTQTERGWFTDMDVRALGVDGSDLYVGVWTGGVWRRSLSELTAVDGQTAGNPTEFQLSQNFPNPFNPSTIIRYSIPQRGRVTLKVYDLLGREVQKLVDADEPAGSHSVWFDGSRFATGLYFYRLVAGGMTDSKKFLLLK